MKNRFIKSKNINIVSLVKRKDILKYERDNELLVSELNEYDYMIFVEEMKNKNKILMRC